MATLTNEQIEQKKQLLAEKVKQMDAIFKELKEAGSLELSEEELDSVNGGMNDPRLTGILPELFLDRYKLPLDMLLPLAVSRYSSIVLEYLFGEYLRHYSFY